MNGIEVEDFPDLTHWKHVLEFSLEQAALLLSGIDPFENTLIQVKEHNHPRWKYAYGYAKALESAVRQGTITLIKCFGFIDYESINGYAVEYKEIKQSDRSINLSLEASIVSRSALIGWVSTEKINIVKPVAMKEIKAVHITTIKEPTLQTLPYHGHQSDGLDYVEDAIKQFWSTFDPNDPNTAPTQKEIVDYLISKGATQNMAKAVNLILRPRDLPKRTRLKQDSDT